MTNIIPPVPDASNPPPPDLGLNNPRRHENYEPPHKTRNDLDRHFGIELAIDGSGICVLCEKPGGYPFAGYFTATGGERVRLCDVCLFEESAPLGLMLAAVAFLREVGAVSLPESRRKMAAEIATFSHVFETLLNRRFGAAKPSALLEHLAHIGRLPLKRYPSAS